MKNSNIDLSTIKNKLIILITRNDLILKWCQNQKFKKIDLFQTIFFLFQKALEGKKYFLKNVSVLSRFFLKNLQKIPIFHEKKWKA